MTAQADLQPRIVSFKELHDKLFPLLQVYEWAEKELHDLWKIGAPDPQSKPCKCKDPRTCKHQKRILLPKQFQTWWKMICDKQAFELTAAQALALPTLKGKT